MSTETDPIGPLALIHPLSRTDGYVFLQTGGRMPDRVGILRAHGLSAGWSVTFRDGSAPKLVNGGRRIGYNITPLP